MFLESRLLLRVRILSVMYWESLIGMFLIILLFVKFRFCRICKVLILFGMFLMIKFCEVLNICNFG